MKKFIMLLCCVLFIAGSCSKVDNNDLWDKLQSLDSRVTALEELCKKMNTNIDALRELVDAAAGNDYITNVAPVKNGGDVIGYTITFAKSDPITIYHGKDGQTPVIGVRKDTDGLYYWTLNGEWLLDENEQKVSAGGQAGTPGKDGITPQLKIQDGKWYVSYNNGSTWVEAGEATGPQGPAGDSMFQNITYDDSFVYFTLADGTKLTIPKSPENAVTLTLNTVTRNSASFNGVIHRKSMDLKVTIYYGTSEDITVYKNEGKVELTEFPENRFEMSVSGLNTGTLYYYFYEVLYNSQAYFSRIDSFKTNDDLSSYEDLSASGTANCYVVSKTGKYKFKAVQGNSSATIVNAKLAEVLWESFGTSQIPTKGDLIMQAAVDGEFVAFQTAATFREGNALIIVRDASQNILWSWHIWMTDIPQNQIYRNGAGVVMDRNLGATSAETDSPSALGLFYQWGRKDPFLGASSVSAPTVAKSTLDWPVSVESSQTTGTIEYAVAHPTTFITAKSNVYDWMLNGNTDRWLPEKTIYDPCPAGYKIPSGDDNGLWAKALGYNYSYTGTTSNKGFDFGKAGKLDLTLTSAESCWYPAAGTFTPETGVSPDDTEVYGIGKTGSYWSCSADTKYSYYFYFYIPKATGSITPGRKNTRDTACSIRCVKES